MNVYKVTHTYIDKPSPLLNITSKNSKRMRSGFSTLWLDAKQLWGIHIVKIITELHAR